MQLRSSKRLCRERVATCGLLHLSPPSSTSSSNLIHLAVSFHSILWERGEGRREKKQEREGGRREGGERKGEGKGEREGREERGRKGVSYCKLEFPTVDTHAELMDSQEMCLM